MEQSGKMKAPKLSCRHVSKSFAIKKSEFQVLEDLSFEVEENEFLVIFGPGQCGKTTLLYMLAGIEPCTDGKIVHNEKEITKPDHSRAVVYQTMALFPWLTVWGNVEFGLKVRNEGIKERRKQVQHFVDLVGLNGFEKSYPVQLSGGMKQRVGIARAYCSNPDVLLMDEPFGHLDAQTRYMMQESLEQIWNQQKRTVVFVTNNIEEALYLADRIILLSSCPGKITAEYRISLPRPRNIMDPEFLKLRKEITKYMDENA
ncbi:MAG TPA: ABC transporter ATP-binding protein [Clostridiales bacterium]|nr:ABC transporter ATP-binding protein [Clostridiales bacterium]